MSERPGPAPAGQGAGRKAEPAAGGPALVSVQGLTKVYRDGTRIIVVLRDLDLDLRAGQTVAEALKGSGLQFHFRTNKPVVKTDLVREMAGSRKQLDRKSVV
jgi:hypothetical protein